MSADEDDAPGWAAIEAAVGRVVGDVEPVHRSTGRLPDQDGPYGVHAYPLDGHWLLLTLGLSELFAKVSDLPEESGWGIELTLRVPRGEDRSPPPWALTLLDRLGGYVFESGRPFGPGHRMDPGGPITESVETRLVGLLFADDPLLGSMTTPFGTVRPVAVVGVTGEELEAAQQGVDATEVLADIGSRDPLLLTDPSR